MKSDLSPELEELRAAVRKFAQHELEPLARQMDTTGVLPDEVLPLLARQGYLSVRLPESVGGMGMGLMPYCVMLEELSGTHRAFGQLAFAGGGMTPIAIAHHGTEEQRRKYLPGLINGTLRTAFALTEPAAGSDNSAMKTRADKVDGGWLLNGLKHYINGAHVADFVMVMAITDPVKRTRGGVTAFLVDRGTPGFEITRVDQAIGSSHNLAEITFSDCRLPDSAVIGKVGAGFELAKESLVDGRMAVSCSCIGIADRLLDMATEHAKQRVTFGKPLAERQAIQWMLADSAVELAAARALTYETLRQYDAGKPIGTRPSMCKLYASEMVGRVADRAVQIFGGQGLIRGFPVERMYRDVRHYRIGEGASEILRMIIAKELIRGG